MWLEDKLAVLKKFDERREEIETEHQRVLRDVDVEKQRAKELVDEMERKCIRDKENIKRGVAMCPGLSHENSSYFTSSEVEPTP